eukprot:5632233-Prymnesium_polylepis.1
MVWRRHGGKKIEPSGSQVSINTKLSDAQTMTFDNSQRQSPGGTLYLLCRAVSALYRYCIWHCISRTEACRE